MVELNNNKIWNERDTSYSEIIKSSCFNVTSVRLRVCIKDRMAPSRTSPPPPPPPLPPVLLSSYNAPCCLLQNLFLIQKKGNEIIKKKEKKWYVCQRSVQKEIMTIISMILGYYPGCLISSYSYARWIVWFVINFTEDERSIGKHVRIFSCNKQDLGS